MLAIPYACRVLDTHYITIIISTHIMPLPPVNPLDIMYLYISTSIVLSYSAEPERHPLYCDCTYQFSTFHDMKTTRSYLTRLKWLYIQLVRSGPSLGPPAKSHSHHVGRTFFPYSDHVNIIFPLCSLLFSCHCMPVKSGAEKCSVNT